MFLIIYNALLTFLLLPAKIILSLFLPKLREREKHAAQTIEKLAAYPKNGKRIWFHAASMGEFEQAKPVIEQIKQLDSNIQIICTFYSPSGYNIQKNYPYADLVLYLPFDTYFNARSFVSELSCDLAVFVRYDAWFNHLFQLKKHNVKTILINATRTKSRLVDAIPLLKIYYKKVYSLFDIIYTVGAKHSDFFEGLNITPKIFTSSDTRMDRIVAKVDSAKQNNVIAKHVFESDNILVAGSIWEEDFKLLANAVKNINSSVTDKITCIYVPHEPHKEFIAHIQESVCESILLSELQEIINKDASYKIKSGSAVIVDSIGKLLMLYGNAKYAYIGGAFGAGVHSLTEPAGFGIPVICGKNYHNSPDASTLIQSEALVAIDSSEELEKILRIIHSNDDIRNKMGNAAYQYVYACSGSSQIVAYKIMELLK